MTDYLFLQTSVLYSRSGTE